MYLALAIFFVQLVIISGIPQTSNVSRLLIPLDSQSHHVLPNLPYHDWFKIRGVCIAWNEIIQQKYQNQYMKTNRFFQLAMWVRNELNHSRNALQKFNNKLGELKLDEYAICNHTTEDIVIIMVEKVICEIAANKFLHNNRSAIKRMVNCFLSHLTLSTWPIANEPRFRLMLQIISEIDPTRKVIYDPFNDHSSYLLKSQKVIHLLTMMFQFAQDEMIQSGNKYNRYTLFAFTYLDIILSTIDESDVKFKHWILRSCMVGVEFIDDFLKKRYRFFHDFLQNIATDLILTDAFGPNGSFSTNNLYLFSKYPRSFDFWYIMEYLDWYLSVPENVMFSLLDYFVERMKILQWKDVMLQTQKTTNSRASLARILYKYAKTRCTNLTNSGRIITEDIWKNYINPYLFTQQLYTLRRINSDFAESFRESHPQLDKKMMHFHCLHSLLSTPYEGTFLSLVAEISVHCQRIRILNKYVYDKFDKQLIEKLLYTILIWPTRSISIMTRGGLRREDVSVHFLSEFSIAVPPCIISTIRNYTSDPILLLHRIIVITESHGQWKFPNRLVRVSVMNTFKLHSYLLNELFQLSINETLATGVEYNRFTKSALFYMDWIFSEIKYADKYYGNNPYYNLSADYENCILLLNGIINIGIIDAVNIMQLNSCSLWKKFISLIINDLFQHNNTGRLSLFLLNNHLLFNFDFIIDEIVKIKRINNQCSMYAMEELIKFINQYQLISMNDLKHKIQIKYCQLITSLKYNNNSFAIDLAVIDLGVINIIYQCINHQHMNTSTISLNPLNPRRIQPDTQYNIDVNSKRKCCCVM